VSPKWWRTYFRFGWLAGKVLSWVCGNGSEFGGWVVGGNLAAGEKKRFELSSKPLF
jgi:hypothetical protein